MGDNSGQYTSQVFPANGGRNGTAAAESRKNTDEEATQGDKNGLLYKKLNLLQEKHSQRGIKKCQIIPNKPTHSYTDKLKYVKQIAVADQPRKFKNQRELLATDRAVMYQGEEFSAKGRKPAQ